MNQNERRTKWDRIAPWNYSYECMTLSVSRVKKCSKSYHEAEFHYLSQAVFLSKRVTNNQNVI